MDRSDRFTRDLLQKLADLEQSTRAAAAQYERTDAASGREIAATAGDSRLLNL
ncbi:hypothetical protein IHQ52_02830 [Gordonia amicalis]|uniref:hypothetical protein n=1 Tax=Gordonia amicalis TaxID=89053 RepID=UPI000426C8C0|nr:hypothetical protein [Gordonia amicalis]UKO92371.1 hypothetical protein IHQ52_02830 [Gordonia amicalis]UOG20388.1 hypothetical protein MTX80_14625 [Gordonia amicalis]